MKTGDKLHVDGEDSVVKSIITRRSPDGRLLTLGKTTDGTYLFRAFNPKNDFQTQFSISNEAVHQLISMYKELNT